MNNIYKKASSILNIDESLIKRIYESYWLFIRTTIENLPLKEDLTEEEFSQLRPNFNLPSLGKLSCTYDRYLRIKKSNNIKLKKYEDKKSKTPT